MSIQCNTHTLTLIICLHASVEPERDEERQRNGVTAAETLVSILGLFYLYTRSLLPGRVEERQRNGVTAAETIPSSLSAPASC
jgi:hypothetical protein